MNKSEVIIEVGAEGGSITLYGIRTERSWFFARKVIEIDLTGELFDDERIDKKSDAVDSWEAALKLLDQYPWSELYPISIHPDFRQQVWIAVQERLQSNTEISQFALKRWRELCSHPQARTGDGGMSMPVNGDPADRSSGANVAIDPKALHEAFARFQQLILAKSGHRFTNFDEGLAAVWESYKPRLRNKALELLAADSWSETGIGSGAILQHTIEAIEIQDSRANLTNNLVFWQNRFGHANRDHRVLLEAASNPKLRRDLAHLLFGLYRGDADHAVAFNRLSELTGGKYPLL
jgi:hypothetical protein